MSWRKLRDTPDGQPQQVQVTEETPLPVQVFNNSDEEPILVQGTVSTSETALLPIGMQSALSITDTAVPLTPTANAVKATLQVFGGAVRFRVDGVVPTATTGFRADVYDIVNLYGAEVANFRAIREGGVSATAEITYYGQGV